MADSDLELIRLLISENIIEILQFDLNFRAYEITGLDMILSLKRIIPFKDFVQTEPTFHARINTWKGNVRGKLLAESLWPSESFLTFWNRLNWDNLIEKTI